MTQVQKMSGAFLTKDDVKTGDILKIVDEGKYVEKEFKGKKRKGFDITVELPDGTEKTASLNATSFNLLIDYMGDDTANWIGKEVRAEIITMSVSGEMKKVVYITPPTVDAAGDIIVG